VKVESYRGGANKNNSNHYVRRTRRLNGKALLTLMWAAGTAVASSEDDSKTGSLGEIIVTAQERETGLEKTPSAESVFTPSSIEANRIQGIDDIAFRVPSVSFVQINKGEAYISCRHQHSLSFISASMSSKCSLCRSKSQLRRLKALFLLVRFSLAPADRDIDY
jgi:hypothetical protein